MRKAADYTIVDVERSGIPYLGMWIGGPMSSVGTKAWDTG